MLATHIFLGHLHARTQADDLVSVTNAGLRPAREAVLIASLLPGIAPGAWITIKGSNLTATTRFWNSLDVLEGNLPRQLEGVNVSIDGRDAAVYFVSPGKVTALTPGDTAVGPVCNRRTRSHPTGDDDLPAVGGGVLHVQQRFVCEWQIGTGPARRRVLDRRKLGWPRDPTNTPLQALALPNDPGQPSIHGVAAQYLLDRDYSL
jgi:hypothetical protein